MKHGYFAKLDSIMIRPLVQDDIEYLRIWRNDKNVSRFFRKIEHITASQQLFWFQQYLIRKDCYYWAIVENNQMIGALSIYDISGTTAEIGRFMIGNPEFHGKNYGYKSLVMAMKIGFECLKLNMFRLNVHIKNISAFTIYKRAGFEISGRHYFDERGDELEMIIDKDKFMNENPLVSEIKVHCVWGGNIGNINSAIFKYSALEVA